MADWSFFGWGEAIDSCICLEINVLRKFIGSKMCFKIVNSMEWDVEVFFYSLSRVNFIDGFSNNSNGKSNQIMPHTLLLGKILQKLASRIWQRRKIKGKIISCCWSKKKKKIKKKKRRGDRFLDIAIYAGSVHIEQWKIMLISMKMKFKKKNRKRREMNGRCRVTETLSKYQILYFIDFVFFSFSLFLYSIFCRVL